LHITLVVYALFVFLLTSRGPPMALTDVFRTGLNFLRISKSCATFGQRILYFSMHITGVKCVRSTWCAGRRVLSHPSEITAENA